MEPAAIQRAYNSISTLVHKTPVLTSQSIDSLLGSDKHLYFKCENFQKTGSFKARGALNAVRIIKQSPDPPAGVVTHSSGNHGQALAYAAQHYGIPCAVVAPRNAPRVKLDAIAGYGAKLIMCEPTMQSRVETCNRVVSETNYRLVHPHDDCDIMAGQGTIGIELLSQVPQLDAVLVPVGGGGLCSGIAAWIKHQKPQCKVYCVEPEGKELEASFRAEKRLWPQDSGMIDTIADGMRVLKIGANCFPELLRSCEKQVLTVNDQEITAAMKLVYQRLKLVIEPSAATTLAAALKCRAQLSASQHLAVILCGGNQDLAQLPWQT